jgi:hypothetical protein
MKYQLGFLIIVRHVACETCSVDEEDVCLLQLRNGNNMVGEVESEYHFEANRHGDLSSTAIDKLRREKTVGTVEIEDQVMSGEDETEKRPPQAPTWDEYPSTLVGLLDTMVVTRWYGDSKGRQSSGLSSPVPGLYKKFDCVMHESFHKTSRQCRTLLVENKMAMMNKCSHQINMGTLHVTSGAFVAFLGTDHFLSDPGYLKVVKRIGKHFQKTYYESYNVMDDDVDVLPIGLSEYYLRFQDWNVMSTLAKNLSPSSTPADIPKDDMVLGAFGAFYSSIENPSRKSAGELCESHGQESWLTCEEVPKDEWWSTLLRFRFMLNPTGNGEQSSKFYEALLTRTVPICTKGPSFLKLHEKGWPMVLVDSFDEVKDLNLLKIYEELRPRLESIQKHLHLDAYWNYLLTGHL